MNNQSQWEFLQPRLKKKFSFIFHHYTNAIRPSLEFRIKFSLKTTMKRFSKAREVLQVFSPLKTA